jgi:hypothetical protein
MSVSINSEFKQNTMSYILTVMEGSNSTLAHVAAERAARHDSGRTQKSDAKLYANAKLNLLREHGDDYVTAYYLHHYLDFLGEEWRSGENAHNLIEELRSKYQHLGSEEIEQFLHKNESDLVRDLN